MKNLLKKVSLGSLAFVSASSFANTDYSTITAGINFETAAAAIVGAGAAIAVVYIAIAGTRGVLRMLKSA